MGGGNLQHWVIGGHFREIGPDKEPLQQVTYILHISILYMIQE